VLGLSAGELLRRSALHHFRWLQEQGGRV
jgi:hypothetical protein